VREWYGEELRKQL